MIGKIQIVTFDTNAHNRLIDDPRSESVLAEVRSMGFRFAGLSIEELFATSPASRRDALFAGCRKIQSGPSECLLPSNLLVEKLILAHFNGPAAFNWKAVDVRWPECNVAIRNPSFYKDEQISKEQRNLQWNRTQSDKQRFVNLRPELQAILEARDEEAPTTCRQAISRLEDAEKSALWYLAQFYYDLVTTTDSNEAMVREFGGACPPFLAVVYAWFLPWYNNALRNPHRGERAVAGSNDLYMSAYLPYVDIFVTDDTDQEKALREVAGLAKLETKIMSYDDFCATLLVPV